jgi:hypothetical protein
MADLTLWLLNRCVRWEKDFLAAHLADRFHVRVGQRLTPGGAATAPPETDDGLEIHPMAVNEGEDGAPGELMHEGAAVPAGHIPIYDEYFMPVPLKCVGALGSDFWKGIASPEGLDRLAELGAHLAGRFPPGNEFSRDDANRTIGPHFGDVRMNLIDKSVGYYQLLRRASDETGALNLLVGYSQGGTVARYLAFLDEHIARSRCIHSIVTVQAPNRGSPVASSQKRDSVSRAFIGILLSLAQWLPADYQGSEVWKFLGAAQKPGSLVDFIAALLDALLESFPASDPKCAGWLTARKWLSGLSGIEDLAFWDLDPKRIAEPGAVLQAIAAYPLTAIQHGAVVGTDNDLVDLIGSALHGAPWYDRLLEKLVAGEIASLVAQASVLYRNEVLSFGAGTPGSAAGDYLAGIAAGDDLLDRAIAPLAHDFVIPSISQLLLPARSGVHLGHLVNPRANHLSGAERWAGWGTSDEELVGQLLDHVQPVPGQPPKPEPGQLTG